MQPDGIPQSGIFTKSGALTQERVRKLFDYHEDGYLIWKVRSAQKIQIGDRAGYIGTRGYWMVGINGKRIGVHRIIFLWHHGWLPIEIDHEDRKPGNNWISNLRASDRPKNLGNTGRSITNTSGFKGVSWHKAAKRWEACISIGNRKKYLGTFDTPEAAHAAYCVAGIELRGEFFNAG